MRDFAIVLEGVPRTSIPSKLKVIIEKQVGKDLIKNIEKPANDNFVIIKFRKEKDLILFQEANVTQIEYGEGAYQLTVVNQDLGDPPPIQGTSREDSPRTSPNSIAVDDEVPFWSSFQELPAPEGTSCVLAQNIDASTSFQKVKMHFEAKKRSNGGPVRKIVKMNDGFVVIFQNARDCESCLEKEDQIFERKNLVIFRKKIPTYFERKFVIEGVSSSTTADTLIMFLERCCTKQATPEACKQALSGVYIIEYGEDLDPQNAKQLLNEVPIEPLESKPLKASRLLRTDCLKVSGIQDDVSNDTVLLTFENKRKTGGGPVTRVDRLKIKAVLVYFADFADAERVYERFKQPNVEAIVIGQCPVEVNLYFHSLENDHKSSVDDLQTEQLADQEDGASTSHQTLHSFEILSDSVREDKILLFFKTNRTHSNKLENALEELAFVEILTESMVKGRSSVQFTPKTKTDKSTQESFNKHCTKIFYAVLSEYEFDSPTLDHVKLQKARAAEGLFPLLDETYTGDGENIVVRWKDGSVDVTGLRDAVNEWADNLKRSSDLMTESEESQITVDPQRETPDFPDENSGRFCFQMPYGRARFIVEKSKEFSQEPCRNEGIRCGLTSEGGGGVYVEGRKESLDRARPRMDQLIQDIAEIKQTLIQPGIKQYFEGHKGRDFLKMTERANNCIILPMKRTCPEWERKTGSGRQMPELAAVQTSQEQRYISVTLPNSRVTLQVWKTNIIEHKCDVIINASNPQLQLLSGGVSGEIRKLDTKSGDAIQTEMTMLIRENHGDYLSGEAVITTAGNLKNCKKIVHAVGPRWYSTSERDPKNALKSCIFKSLEETSHVGMTSIAIPAISCGVFGGKVNVCIPLIVEAVVDYFRENTNSSIKTVDFVEIDMDDVLTEFKKCVQKHVYSSSEYENQQPLGLPTLSASSQPATYLVSPTAPTVKLQTGDIASVQADVLVNITNPQGFPTMTGSAVSKALLNKAGTAIQQECAQIPGPHNVGSVFRTNGGGLFCQEICHGIVSHYNINSEQIVTSIVRKCLNQVDSAGYSSMAFPAIATGGYSHPAAEVARWMRKEIYNFTAVNLKTVIIVLYPRDTLTISTFQSEFNGVPMPSSATSGSGASFGSFQSSGQTARNFGVVKVNVYLGDITQETSDAIVNSTSSLFDLSQGMVSMAIVRQGGHQIKTDVQSATGTDLRVTSGGNLRCRSIFHIVAPFNEKDMAKKIDMVLDNADQRGIKSISFPALATGTLGFSSASVAQTMRRAFENFGKRRVTTLKTVNVVIFDRSMLKDFQTGILGPNKSLFWKLKETFSSYFGGNSVSNKSLGDGTFDLFFYSTEVGAINTAYEAITRETKKTVRSHVMQDDAFGRFSEWDFSQLNEVATTNKVKISNKSTRYLKQYTIEGYMQHVIKATEAVNDILKDFNEAEITATYVTWQKRVRGVWEDYEPRSANVLEKAFQARNGNRTDPKLNRITVPECRGRRVHTTTVDLSNLEGDVTGRNPPSVRRKVKEKVETDVLPSNWDPMPSQQPYLKVSLQQSSPEYKTVYQKYTQTGGLGAVLKIERIQNVSLHKQYFTKLAEVTKKMLNKNNPVSRQLFHGTSDADKIILHGFDRSYAGKNATAYGRGVYFATTASYSNTYAAPDPQGQKKMFMADVITGDYCQGNSTLVAPPPRQGAIKNDLYDSVVNNAAGPFIFVIFKDASAYPTYLITYQ